MTKLGEEHMDYHDQVKQNEWSFFELVKSVRPDLWMLANLLKETKVNYLILVHVIRHLSNVATGSRFGTVTIDVQDGVATFVRGQENSRLNEVVILQEN